MEPLSFMTNPTILPALSQDTDYSYAGELKVRHYPQALWPSGTAQLAFTQCKPLIPIKKTTNHIQTVSQCQTFSPDWAEPGPCCKIIAELKENDRLTRLEPHKKMVLYFKRREQKGVLTGIQSRNGTLRDAGPLSQLLHIPTKAETVCTLRF